MKRVYISHALWGKEEFPEWNKPEVNFERYLRFVALAMAGGYNVVSWSHHYLLELRNLTPTGLDWSGLYLTRDVELLRMADELWLCCPLSVSNGAKVEYDAAIRFGIPVFSKEDWMDSTYMPKVEPIEFMSEIGPYSPLSQL